LIATAGTGLDKALTSFQNEQVALAGEMGISFFLILAKTSH
jgi:hypothetical protein